MRWRSIIVSIGCVGLLMAGCDDDDDDDSNVSTDGRTDAALGSQDGGPTPDGAIGADTGADTGTSDGGEDVGASDGGPSDADTVEPDASFKPLPTAYAPTSGGGAAASADYKVRLRVGGPQPLGAARSAAHRVTLGPVSAP